VTFFLEPPRQRIAPAAMASAASHFAAVMIAVVLARATTTSRANPAASHEPADKIMWLSEQRAGRGGGGSGDHTPQPPRRAEMPGTDAITVPVETKRSLDAAVDRELDQVQHVNIPAIPTAAGVESIIGALEAPLAPASLSLGPGRGGAAGAGNGTGDGPGDGSGYGPGRGGNTGGDVFQPGGPGITLPHVISEVKPQYTADAMRARVQGMVLLACVVRADGTVGQVRVIRSLDRTFGLDERAIAAAKLWRFAPGTRMGVAVPVQVTIELTFTIR